MIVNGRSRWGRHDRNSLCRSVGRSAVAGRTAVGSLGWATLDRVRSLPGWRWIVADAESIAGAWRALGRQLAASRRAAGFSQERLASLVTYSRRTGANVEKGGQRRARGVWGRGGHML